MTPQIRAKKIKLAVFDVDGVLTDGQLYYTDEGIQTKAFHVHDGLGLKLLQQTGIAIGIITGCASTLLNRRMQDLGIIHVYQGNTDKLPILTQLMKDLNITLEETAFCGDDLPDLPLISRVGLGIAVPNAHPLIRQEAHWQTEARGGHGAVREICEFIMSAQNTLESILTTYKGTQIKIPQHDIFFGAKFTKTNE